MFKVHGYLDGQKIIDWRMQHLPRAGDTVRIEADQYAKVTEVIWCLDEPSTEGERVNLRMESEAAKSRKENI